MLASARLPRNFWGVAVIHSACLKNVIPHSTTGSVPWNDVMGRPFDYSLLKTFGADCFVHIPDAQRKGKLGDRAQHGIWLGIDLSSMSNKVLLAQSNRVVSSLHVSVGDRPGNMTDSHEVLTDIDTFMAPVAHIPVPQQVPQPAQEELPQHLPLPDLPPTPAPVTPPGTPVPPAAPLTPPGAPALHPAAAVEGEMVHQRPQLPRNARTHPNPRYDGYMLAAASSNGDKEPETIDEALASPQWSAALATEIDALTRNNTWTAVPRVLVPTTKRILPVKVVWKIKYSADGKPTRHKARVVIGGHRQRQGIDYNDVFAPTLGMTSLRALLSHAAVHGHHIHNIDIKSAFLYADIHGEVYMVLPPTVPNKDEQGQELVARLNKCLYGLHESPLRWSETITAWLIKQGFSRSTADTCVFTKDNIITIGLFVDDLVLISASLEAITDLKTSIKERFDITDNGHISEILGLQVDYDRTNRCIKLYQHGYATSVLERFGMIDCKPVSTPMIPHAPLKKTDEAGNFVPADSAWYKSVVGSLIYLSNSTRPDLAFAVGMLARFMSDPGEHHAVAAKRVLRYLAGTQDHGLTYRNDKSAITDTVTGYSDADFAEDPDSRKSTTGLCFMMNGAAISWMSKRQPTVASSTAEAEYTALFSGTQEAMFLRQLLTDIGIVCETITMNEDNQPAIFIANNPTTSSHSKHFDVRLHYTREKVQEGTIKLQYCPTADMVADMLTKATDRIKFEKFRSTAMGLDG
jgi:hypothetical protein